MSKDLWLYRDLIVGPHLALVLTEADYHQALDEMGLPAAGRDPWIMNDQADATAHILEHNGPMRGLCVVVCLRTRPELEPIGIACLLVHEAVHVFQRFCAHIGERAPSAEFEAYSIQAISQRLMSAYADTLTA